MRREGFMGWREKVVALSAGADMCVIYPQGGSMGGENICCGACACRSEQGRARAAREFRLCRRSPPAFLAGMNPHTSPPPLPPAAGRNRLWILLTTLAVVVVLAMVAAGVIAFSAYRRIQERKAASRAAMDRFETTANEERAKMADLIEGGEAAGGDAAFGRVKALLEKSAVELGSGDDGVARAMASYVGKMQVQVRDYEATVARMAEAEVFSFHPRDKGMIETHRQLIRDFLASNARITDATTRAGELVRAELDAAKIPAKARDAALLGLSRSQQTTRPLQIQIRKCDQTLGDSALAILDLLEKEWGRWSYDEAAGGLLFDDEATLAAHGVLIEKIQAASEEQAKAQAAVAANMRAGSSR